jgi:hypothetical protein
MDMLCSVFWRAVPSLAPASSPKHHKHHGSNMCCCHIALLPAHIIPCRLNVIWAAWHAGWPLTRCNPRMRPHTLPSCMPAWLFACLLCSSMLNLLRHVRRLCRCWSGLWAWPCMSTGTASWALQACSRVSSSGGNVKHHGGHQLG